jgi:hypothetical protein
MNSRTHRIDWLCLVSSEARGDVCLYPASALENAFKESTAYPLMGPSRLYEPLFPPYSSQFQPGYRSQKNIQSP